MNKHFFTKPSLFSFVVKIICTIPHGLSGNNVSQNLSLSPSHVFLLNSLQKALFSPHVLWRRCRSFVVLCSLFHIVI